MGTGLVWGSCVGAGLWLLARGLAPPRPRLAGALADLARPRSSVPVRSLDRRLRVVALMLVRGGGAAEPLRRDLALVERSLERHALDRLTMATLGLGLPVAVGALAAAGGLGLPAVLVALAALAGAGTGFVLPDVALRAEAARRRREFRSALAAYLDLVTIVLAGGGGVESALEGAAATGGGPAFARLRRTLAGARLQRESPWAALDRLGVEVGVAELAELAGSVALAGDAGAKVRASLGAKAASLRDHELAEAQAAAESASERMGGPVVAMLVGFILLLGYPAVATVLAL